MLRKSITARKWLLLAVFLVMSFSVISAQDAGEPQNTISISVAVDGGSTNPYAYRIYWTTLTNLRREGINRVVDVYSDDIELGMGTAGNNIDYYVWYTYCDGTSLIPSTILVKTPRFACAGLDIYLQPSDAAGAYRAANILTAVSLYSINRCDIALKYFDRALKDTGQLQPSTNDLNGWISFYMGNCALLNSDWDASIGFFESALNGSDENIHWSTGVNLSWVYLKSGNTAKAFETMNYVVDHVSRAGNKSITLMRRAQLHALNFDYDTAIQDANAAIELMSPGYPDYPELLIQRGQIRMLLYEWDAVMDDYNTALELDPYYADAYYFRGVLNYTVAGVGNSDVLALKRDAITDFERYLELAPNGLHAPDATTYIDQIQTELDALEGD